jgi:S-adenosylmethionine decarboxylase
MISFKEWKKINEADYCMGLSINADFWWNKPQEFLKTSNHKTIESLLLKASVPAKMKVIDKKLTTYGINPEFGYSYLVVLGQSHIMIHTWPEKNMMNIDVFTCGNEGDPMVFLNQLSTNLNPDHIQKNQIKRGVRKDIENTTEQPDRPQDLK